MEKEPLSVIVVGAGHRGLVYADYSLQHPEEMKIVGVADPMERQRRVAAAKYGLDASMCFASAAELAARGRLADAVINGTMDEQHVPTSLPLLEAGYDMLLEKPFATNEREMWQLADTARRLNRKIMICHVLRYAPFYAAVRRRVLDGEIGRIMNIQTVEHVSYHHMAAAFIRGKWNRRDVCKSTFLMAKCCHDLDLITWFKSGIAPVTVSSFGSRMFFREECAPKGSGTRCLVDCAIEPDCPYSARKNYLDHPNRWKFPVWSAHKDFPNLTMEQRIEWLKTGPHGRCVWRCDNDNVDHQTVAIEFADGATAAHNLVGGAARARRAVHLLGTNGEIQGVADEDRFVIRHMDPSTEHGFSEEVVDLDKQGDMSGAYGSHGGGDLRLAADFVRFLRGEPRSLSCTSIEDSINGHLLGFRADQAREERRVVKIGPRTA